MEWVVLGVYGSLCILGIVSLVALVAGAFIK